MHRISNVDLTDSINNNQFSCRFCCRCDLWLIRGTHRRHRISRACARSKDAIANQYLTDGHTGADENLLDSLRLISNACASWNKLVLVFVCGACILFNLLLEKIPMSLVCECVQSNGYSALQRRFLIFMTPNYAMHAIDWMPIEFNKYYSIICCVPKWFCGCPAANIFNTFVILSLSLSLYQYDIFFLS